MVGEMKKDVEFWFIEPADRKGTCTVEEIVDGGAKKMLTLASQRAVHE